MKAIRIGVLFLISSLQAQDIEIPIENISSLSDSVYMTNLTLSHEDIFWPTIKITAEVANRTHYQIYFVDLTFFLKNESGDILGRSFARAQGETIVDLGVVSTSAIDPGKTGFFADELWQEINDFALEDIASYSVSIDFDTQAAFIPGDLDRDGDVDFADFFVFADNFGRKASVPAGKLVASSATEQYEKQILTLRAEIDQLRRKAAP